MNEASLARDCPGDNRSIQHCSMGSLTTALLRNSAHAG